MARVTLKALAEQINREFTDLHAVTYPAGHPLGGYSCTDRDIPGTRLRRPGKCRRGTLLTVIDKATGRVVMRHNAAETYRRNDDVVYWIKTERNIRSGKIDRSKLPMLHPHNFMAL